MATQKKEIGYVLEDQVGHIMRKANQRHTGIFSSLMPNELTPTRFAALVKLHELGPLSQNELGRLTAMDVATIKGVVDRLKQRDLVQGKKDEADARRQIISLTAKGTELVSRIVPLALEVSRQTTAPLTQSEARTLNTLLKKLA